MAHLYNCYRTKTLKDAGVWGKIHACNEHDHTLCGMVVEGAKWYLSVSDAQKVTCPRCQRELESSHIATWKARKAWAAQHGNYVDRFFASLDKGCRDITVMSPRDVAAEFFEFLKAEGRLKK